MPTCMWQVHGSVMGMPSGRSELVPFTQSLVITDFVVVVVDINVKCPPRFHHVHVSIGIPSTPAAPSMQSILRCSTIFTIVSTAVSHPYARGSVVITIKSSHHRQTHHPAQSNPIFVIKSIEWSPTATHPPSSCLVGVSRTLCTATISIITMCAAEHV